MMIDSGSGDGGGTLERFSTSVPTAVGTAMTVLKSFGLDGLLTNLANSSNDSPVDASAVRESVVNTITDALADPYTRKEVLDALARAEKKDAS